MRRQPSSHTALARPLPLPPPPRSLRGPARTRATRRTSSCLLACAHLCSLPAFLPCRVRRQGRGRPGGQDPVHRGPAHRGLHARLHRVPALPDGGHWQGLPRALPPAPGGAALARRAGRAGWPPGAGSRGGAAGRAPGDAGVPGWRPAAALPHHRFLPGHLHAFTAGLPVARRERPRGAGPAGAPAGPQPRAPHQGHRRRVGEAPGRRAGSAGPAGSRELRHGARPHPSGRHARRPCHRRALHPEPHSPLSLPLLPTPPPPARRSTATSTPSPCRASPARCRSLPAATR